MRPTHGLGLHLSLNLSFDVSRSLQGESIRLVRMQEEIGFVLVEEVVG